MKKLLLAVAFLTIVGCSKEEVVPYVAEKFITDSDFVVKAVKKEMYFDGIEKDSILYDEKKFQGLESEIFYFIKSTNKITVEVRDIYGNIESNTTTNCSETCCGILLVKRDGKTRLLYDFRTPNVFRGDGRLGRNEDTGGTGVFTEYIYYEQIK